MWHRETPETGSLCYLIWCRINTCQRKNVISTGVRRSIENIDEDQSLKRLT